MSGQVNSTRLEVEVKFLIQSLPDMRRKLLDIGARQTKPRLFERNWRYDSPWEGLRRAGKLLRLRQDDRAIITFKGPAPEDEGSEARVREELEVVVDDFEQARLILERVGFEAFQVYEKYRETFDHDSVEIVLDELPFGDFIELEGKEADIRQAADALGLDWERRILVNYLGLMMQAQSYYELDFDDLTFENFKGKHYPIGPVLAGEK